MQVVTREHRGPDPGPHARLEGCSVQGEMALWSRGMSLDGV